MSQKSKCHGASVSKVGEGLFKCDVCGHEANIMGDDQNKDEVVQANPEAPEETTGTEPVEEPQEGASTPATEGESVTQADKLNNEGGEEKAEGAE